MIVLIIAVYWQKIFKHPDWLELHYYILIDHNFITTSDVVHTNWQQFYYNRIPLLIGRNFISNWPEFNY